MNVVLIVALFSFILFAQGNQLQAQTLIPPSIVRQIPSGQNISTPGAYGTSSFSFDGLVFITLNPEGNSTSVVAFTNDTFQLVQQQTLPGYQCYNPQFTPNSNDDSTFFLLCSSLPNISGMPVIWVIRPVQDIFFRFTISDNLGSFADSNWMWIPATPYLWSMDQSLLAYVYTSFNNLYYSVAANGIDYWASDLEGFTWTNMTFVPSSPLTVILVGYYQEVHVLAVVSQYAYSLISGSFDGIELLYYGGQGGQILGLTTTETSSGSTLSLWDFTKLTSAKPKLIGSLTFSSEIEILPTTDQLDSMDYNTFFVVQSYTGAHNVTQVTWSKSGLTGEVFYSAKDSVIGFSADETNLYAYSYGYTTVYPHSA